jgi:excisionase family DNA binding protein
MATTQLDNHDPLLSIDQTAAILGIKRSTLSAMIKDNTAPPFITVGRRFFILLSELRRWVESKHRRAKASQRKRQHEYRVA